MKKVSFLVLFVGFFFVCDVLAVPQFPTPVNHAVRPNCASGASAATNPSNLGSCSVGSPRFKSPTEAADELRVARTEYDQENLMVQGQQAQGIAVDVSARNTKELALNVAKNNYAYSGSRSAVCVGLESNAYAAEINGASNAAELKTDYTNYCLVQ